MKVTIGVSLCLAVVLCAGPAAAEDVWPPPWDLLLPNQTSQAWEFPQIYEALHPIGTGPYLLPEEILPPDNQFPPNIIDNPYEPPPNLRLDIDDPQGVGEGWWEWDEPIPGPHGDDIITLHYNGPEGTRGIVTIDIPNSPEPNPYKDMYVQITSDKGVDGQGGPATPPDTNPPGGVSYPHPHTQWPNGTWYTYNYAYHIVPNPDHETLTFYVLPCTNISEIVIDTVCAPEPATMGLLAIGALAVLRRRKH